MPQATMEFHSLLWMYVYLGTPKEDWNMQNHNALYIFQNLSRFAKNCTKINYLNIFQSHQICWRNPGRCFNMSESSGSPGCPPKRPGNLQEIHRLLQDDQEVPERPPRGQTSSHISYFFSPSLGHPLQPQFSHLQSVQVHFPSFSQAHPKKLSF